ncbi:MAG TPA: metal-sulfur cluster assembly factor [Bacilli bacterium]
MSEELTIDQIYEPLYSVYDPELGVNIVDLGLIYDVGIDNGDVYIEMTLTTPGCPMHDTITSGVHAALDNLPGVKSVEVNVVWDPPWSPEKMTDRAREELGYFG